MAQSLAADGTSQTETVSEAVVAAVAELTDADPVSLEPLYSVVDPDALNALFEGDRSGFRRSPTRVEFTYCGCDVVVTADGEVRATESGQEITNDGGWR